MTGRSPSGRQRVDRRARRAGGWSLTAIGGQFRVDVLTSTLPEGSTNTVDPDGGNDSESLLTLVSAESNPHQNFGYDVPVDAPPPAASPSSGSLAFTGSGFVSRLIQTGLSMSLMGLGLLLVSRPGRWRRLLALLGREPAVR